MDIEQKIKEAYDQLPPVVQNIIANSHWEEKVRNIVKKHNLHLDQGMILEDEVAFVMLGIDSPENFIINLKQEAKIPEDVAQKVLVDVESQIFSEIKRALIDMTTKGEIELPEAELDKLKKPINSETKASMESSNAPTLSTSPKPEPQTTPLQHQNETPFHDFDDELEQIKQKESVPISTPIQDLEQNPQTSTSPTTSQDNSTYQTSQTPHISNYDTKSDEINNDISDKPEAEPSHESTTEAPKLNQDPIVAAKLQNPVVSQEKQVDLKIDKNKLQQIKINPKPGEGMKVPTQMHNYNSSDPYREPVE